MGCRDTDHEKCEYVGLTLLMSSDPFGYEGLRSAVRKLGYLYPEPHQIEVIRKSTALETLV